MEIKKQIETKKAKLEKIKKELESDGYCRLVVDKKFIDEIEKEIEEVEGMER
jgi:hypothetical protein